jgi:UDP-GlcNAc:undecaprenyl-phosphate GlcNAc-1-phosphate transferase
MPYSLEPFVTPLLAMGISALVMPLVNRLALRTGFVDWPSARKIHKYPTPLLGGLAIYLGVIVTLLVRAPMDSRVLLMMAASFVVMLIGVADDRLDLHSRYRLLLQVGVALGLSGLGVRFHFFPWVALDHLVTAFWIVGVINAMNCLDCADGAAGGTCAVIFGTLAALAAAHQRSFVNQAALAGLGAVLGFLLYNRPPARVFMGDTGSTFLGLMVAVLAILATRQPVGAWHVPPAPFILTIPVLDIIWVHSRRYQAGITAFRDLMASTGKDHLPHRLMARGLGKPMCMGVVVFLAALAAVSTYLLAKGLWFAGLMGIIALVAFLWHLEENTEVIIRKEDGVAIYRVRPESRSPRSTLSYEERA